MISRKSFVLVILAAVSAMSLAGATSASATSTQLCQVHTSLTCSGGTARVGLVLAAGTVGRLLAAISILCLDASTTVLPLGLGTPQSIHTLGLGFGGCGTGSGHSDCTVTIPTGQQPLYDLLKTGLDEGTLTAVSGQTRLKCPSLFGLDCLYDVAGMEFSVGGGHLTAEETPTTELGGKFLCPDEGLLDVLLETTTASTEPSLCKIHTSICESGNVINSIKVNTTSAPVLLNNVANVECESSSGAATVLDLMLPLKPIELDVTELTWKGCHPQGSGNSCTVTSKALPKIDLQRTALNLGTATSLGLQIGVECASLELNCTYGGNVVLAFEGALHSEGAGHGMLTASEDALSKIAGGGNCPETVKWDALYELSEHAYLGPALTGSNTYILG